MGPGRACTRAGVVETLDAQAPAVMQLNRTANAPNLRDIAGPFRSYLKVTARQSVEDPPPTPFGGQQAPELQSREVGGGGPYVGAFEFPGQGLA